MSRKEQIGFQSGAGILLISAIFVKIIGALFKIPISSSFCLDDEGFGYFSYAYDYFTPLYTIAMGGFPVALAQIIARRGEETDGGERVFLSAKKLYGRIGILFFAVILAFCAAQYVFGKSVFWLLPFLMIAPAGYFCSAMSSYRGYYEGFGDMKPTAISELLEAACKLILGFSFAYLTVRLTHNLAFGAAAAILGITIGTAVACLYLKVTFTRSDAGNAFLRQKVEKTGHDDLTKKLIGMALPVTIAALSANMAPLIDALTAQASLGATLYGLRGKAYTLYNLVPAFAVFLAVSAVPAVSHADAASNTEKRQSDIASIIKFSAVMAFPMAAGLTATSTSVMRLLFGAGDTVQLGGSLLRIFGVTAFFSGLAIPLTGILQAIGKQKNALVNIAVGAGLKLLLNCVLVSIPSIGVLGTAYGTLACYFCIFALHIISLRRAIGSLGTIFSGCVKSLLAAFVCGGVALLILQFGSHSLFTLTAIISAVVTYFALLILLKCFAMDDIPENMKNAKWVKFCRKHRILR